MKIKGFMVREKDGKLWVNRVMKDDKLLMNLYYPDESIDEKTQKIQKRDNLRKIIETLPESQKEVVLLFYFEHLKFKEIAELTNSKINTVLGRMHRAIENLREIKMKSYLNL
jgi:RNA polymerase sigma-70 factor (ECF subfamily)